MTTPEIPISQPPLPEAIVQTVPSPCFVVDRSLLERNGRLLARVQEDAGCRILLALKGFALAPAFPAVEPYLAGTTSSGLHEALLAREYFGKETHVYSPAFREDDLREILGFADHVVFNSVRQWLRFRPLVEACGRPVSPGLRINPEHSTGAVPLYDPATPGSRLGITLDQLDDGAWRGIDGLHFHTLCEQNVEPLAQTLEAVERNFGRWLPGLRWINFGGGHHITREDYQVDRLIRLIRDFRQRHPHLAVYLEPGEAVALGTGYLVCSVLDLFESRGRRIAILDTSATTHMPDVLEMPYRPPLFDAGLRGERAHTCRLGGLSCLAGDVIGDWSFDHPLEIGQRLVFGDMAHYTLVKTTTFNGVPLPAIALSSLDRGTVEVVREFGYEAFRDRLTARSR